MKFAFISILAISASAARLLAAPVDFVGEVQPIFSQHCVSCHGPDKQKSGYRLDVKSVALTGGEAHAPNIVPGKGAASPLLKFVSGEDREMLMPPKGQRLSEKEIAVLRSWIDAGAPWPEEASVKQANPLDWWSLQPMKKPVPPPGADHPVDAFVRATLAEKGLPWSPRADARTLIRRLYFDLTGLPPSPEEMESFAADASPDAYEKLVDRLLASPRHGERWARHWLDVVHYGDTHGYDKDKSRPNAWPYRDYVIRSLNEDKPYARFIEEQIAGDAMYPGSADGIEAMGFIAAGPWDLIGHAEVPETKTDGKIARHLDRDDMVSNTLGTFCSVTIHCAQCHQHKFDPISQEDYYSLQAVFAALDRTDRRYHRDAATNQRFQELQTRRGTVEAEIAALEKPLVAKAGKTFDDLSKKIAAAKKAPLAKPAEHGYHSGISPVRDAVKWVQVDLGQTAEIASISLLPCHDDYNSIGAGFGFPVRFRIEVSDDPNFREGVVPVREREKETAAADFANPGLSPFVARPAKGGRLAGRYVRVTATRLAERKNDYILALAEMQVLDASGKNLALGRSVTALDSIESGARWAKANLTDGRAPGSGPVEDAGKLSREREALLLSVASEAEKTRRTALLAENARLDEEIKKLPPPSVVYAGGIHSGSGNFIGTGGSGGKPRPVHLLIRGQVTRPGKEVQPGALASLTFAPGRFLLSPGAPEGERRAVLARWITDPENPLTWRSIVNRVWQYHFGRGLVETANDFGRNGALPTHPGLLDWLAMEFRDSGGSLKKLHKGIVMSETYRQSSLGNPEAERADANNTLLWRQNRRKLEAEAVRDAVLAVSGKLDLTMGGPGWQDFVIERPEHSPHYQYHLADPQDARTWRRSIYRFIVRSQTQPWMTSLDCADPSIRVDKRNESLSPLQALALLNNGFVLAQAEHFAARVERERTGLPEQVIRAHELALGRAPGPADREKLVAFARDNGLPSLCRVLLNLSEFSFVD